MVMASLVSVMIAVISYNFYQGYEQVIGPIVAKGILGISYCSFIIFLCATFFSEKDLRETNFDRINWHLLEISGLWVLMCFAPKSILEIFGGWSESCRTTKDLNIHFLAGRRNLPCWCLLKPSHLGYIPNDTGECLTRLWDIAAIRSCFIQTDLTMQQMPSNSSQSCHQAGYFYSFLRILTRGRQVNMPGP